MIEHAAKYPQAKHDYEAMKLSKRQAVRLAALSGGNPNAFVSQSIRDLRAKAELGIDASWLFGRRICGRVVKKDANGNDLPVPFATVNVYDTDITGTFWSPLGGIDSWFYPLHIHKEKLATVVTDECGRFCVRIPWFDVDYILRWRLERHCYLEWLRKPSIRDILERYQVVPHLPPDPDPGPLRIDEHLLRHASRLLDAEQTESLRKLAADAVPGVSTSAAAAVLDAPRWPVPPAAPLPRALRSTLRENDHAALSRLTGLPQNLAKAFDPRKAYGPFIRCHWHIVPEWHLVLDVPDITFEVTQDVNGDGVQDIIYAEGLFDVRWDAGSIPDVELVASPNAIASVTCQNPITGPCGDPAILFAGNYELQQPGNPGNGHNRVTGYALFPNVPRLGGDPSGARQEPGEAPFRSNFYLWGCAERPGANRYRISYTFHPLGGGPVVSGVLGGASWTLVKLVGGVVQYLPVSDTSGWYPIIPRSDGWSPSGLLALVPGGLPTGRYDFVMEFGNASGSMVTPIAGSATQSYAIMIDDSAPANPGITQVEWRPAGSTGWTPLPLGECPVITRVAAQAIEFRVTFSTSAHHLRDVSIAASGCGPLATPTVGTIATGSDLYVQLAGTQTIQHWHETSSDNTSGGNVIYSLAQGAPAGCYNFDFTAVSRAINCNEPLNNTANNLWHVDQLVVWSHQRVTISVQ
jgi:hypothetical protein